MRKVLPIVMTLVLALSNLGFAATAPAKAPMVPAKAPMATEVSKAAIVQSFTATTVTVLEKGKLVTYALNGNTHVTSAGIEGSYADLIKKGLTVSFKAKAGMISHIEIPGIGIQTQGTLASNPTISAFGFLLSNNINVVDVRANTTDSNIVPANTASTTFKAEVSGEEADDAFVVAADGKTADIGDLDVVPGSMKVTVDGKALTVLVTGEFNAATAGDEVKLVKTKTFTSLAFETPLTAAQQKTMTVAFKKVMRNLTATETTTIPLSEDAIIEFNGKKVPFIIEGASSFVTTDLAGSAIYVDSYYKNQVVKFIGAKGNKIVVAMVKDGVQVFTDLVEVTADATVGDINGDPIDFHLIKSGSMVNLTVDPDMGYKAVELYVVK